MTTPTAAATTTTAAAAVRLQEAAATGVPCAPVRDLIGADDVATAYAVQSLIIGDRIAAGATVVGRKIGLTSPAVQQWLGVDTPDFGVLLDDMKCTEDKVVAMNELIQPRAEAEVAFVLGADLTDPPFTAESVRAAVDHARAAIEIVDSRIADWDIQLGDTIADNASSGRYVLGERSLTLAEFDPIKVEMTMTCDGVEVSTGTGAACLGDPLNALAWLATAALEHGDPLRAGQVILSGALGPVHPVPPGAVVRAEITGLGPVTARFSGGDQA